VSGLRGTVTVGVCTKDRPEALARCLRSLRAIGDVTDAVIVLDDGSAPPVEPIVREMLGGDAPDGLRFIRNDASRSLAAGRNRIAREAGTPFVLNLDDDAAIVDADAVRRAVRVLQADARLAAIALAQGDAAGTPWPPHTQPEPVDYACYAATFIGYGHLLRRDAFLAIGGFREAIGINGEEKELSLRLLDAGFRVVYLPDCVVAHLASEAGRDRRRYLHQTVRNDVLGAVYTQPFPLWPAGALVRLRRYFPMRSGWKIDDPGGFRRVLGTLARDLPAALRDRAPVRWSTLRAWRRMTQSAPEPYRAPAAEGAG
jgi:GT2 family glycosyltransferase